MSIFDLDYKKSEFDVQYGHKHELDIYRPGKTLELKHEG